MLSSTVSGGPVCLRCQLGLIRAASRRASPAFITAAQTQIRRNGTEAASSGSPSQQHSKSLEDVLKRQKHEEAKPTDMFGGFDERKGEGFGEQMVKWRRVPVRSQHDDAEPADGRGREQTWRQKWQPEHLEKFEQFGQPDEDVYQRPSNDPYQIRPRIRRPKTSYKSKGNRLLVDSAKISIDILGKPANAIVLKDGGRWQTKSEPPPLLLESLGDEEVKSSVDMKGMVGDEDGPLGLEQVWGNIGGIQPEHDIVSAQEFKQLHDTLMSGFTSAQLGSYIDYHKGKKMLEKPDKEDLPEGVLDMPGIYPWIVSQGQWTPDVSGAIEDLGYPLRGYILKSMTAKERLAMQLIRECWGTSYHDLMDANGRLDVRVREMEFILLSIGTQRWLQAISRAFLKPGKQIEMIRSKNLIRIVAPKAAAETILHEINRTLQNVRTKSFSADLLSIRPLDDALLSEVGRITNSHVRLGESDAEVQVTWIDAFSRQEDSKMEDLKDKVYRLLLEAQTPSRVVQKLNSYPAFSCEAKYMSDHGNKDKLSWRDRRRDWARLCFPLREETSKEIPDALVAEDNLAYEVILHPEDVVRPDLARPGGKPREKHGAFKYLDPPPPPAPVPELTQPTPSGWMPFKVSTSAVFGQVLHLQQSPTEAIVDAVKPPAASTPRVMSPIIPGITSLSLSSWVPFRRPISATSMILMRFLPAPDQDATASQAPPLELRLISSDTDVIGIHSLRAISKVSMTDILLPSEHVDVRTTQTLHAEIPGSSVDSVEGMDALATFLGDSNLSPERGSLETPARMPNLGLPRWLVHQPPAKQKTQIETLRYAAAEFEHAMDAVDHSEEIIPVDYVFAGLEVHRPVETTYDGWKLVYTSIEAGRGGGRRAELTLEAVPGYDERLGRKDPNYIDRANFLRSVYLLAQGRKNKSSESSSGHITWVGDNRKQL